MQLENVEIDRTALLNKYQDVSESGEYILHVQDPNKRFALTLSALSGGRAGIAHFVTHTARLGLVIALRYSYCRRQFSASSSIAEQPVITYQLQQWRLFPLLATNIALGFFNSWLTSAYLQLSQQAESGDINQYFLDANSELHAMSSGAKPYASWHCRDTLQTCRECMGGHGYHAASRIGKLKTDTDPALSYEGENNGKYDYEFSAVLYDILIGDCLDVIHSIAAANVQVLSGHHTAYPRR